MFAGFGAPYMDRGGNRGRPLKDVVFVLKSSIVNDSKVVSSVSLNAMDKNATMIENNKKSTLIRKIWVSYRKEVRKERNVLCRIS